MRTEKVDLVVSAAAARSDPAVPRECIIQAFNQIESGQATVETYPGGEPSLKAVYHLARQIHEQRQN